MHPIDVILMRVGQQAQPHLYLRGMVILSHKLTMPPLSEQFYDDNDSDDNEVDEDEITNASDSRSSEGKIREKEFKVSAFLPHAHVFPIFTPSQQMQIETAKLKAENRALKSGQSRSTTPASSTVAVPTQDRTLHCEYRGIGKRFAVLSELWAQCSILRKPYPPRLQSLGPWDSGRCVNDTVWGEGNIAELYVLTPESYHDLIENSALFADQVRGWPLQVRS